MSRNNGETTLTSYIVGFALSIVLTVNAYSITVKHLAGGWTLTFYLVALAILQLMVQLACFLHLGREARPRWKFMVFWFMLLVVGILVFGSLWIMRNLDYHHDLAPDETDTFIIQDEGIQK